MLKQDIQIGRLLILYVMCIQVLDQGQSLNVMRFLQAINE